MAKVTAVMTQKTRTHKRPGSGERSGNVGCLDRSKAKHQTKEEYPSSNKDIKT